VAARTVLPDLSAVLILMATGAVARKSEISSIEIFDQNSTASRARNEISLVAIRAGDSSMLPRKCEARLGMVHGLAAWFPMNELKIGAVVLRMASRTILAGAIRGYPHGVHAAPLGHAVAYLGVTVKTFQLGSAAAQVVALSAVCRTVQGLMSLRKRPRRDLRASGTLREPPEKVEGCANKNS
jgi:hypothetical protein